MTARPIYTIVVEDMVSHVEWTLMRDDDEVTAGRVELADYDQHQPLRQIGLAFARAWQEANSERVRRLLDDLDAARVEQQHLAKIERERSEVELQDALDEGGSW